MIIIELIYNLSILVALSVFSGFINFRFKSKETAVKIYQGILFGAAAVIGMMYPFVFAEGIIFDGRSIVVSLCAFFFGPLAGGITTIIAAGYRFSLGGSGLTMGISVLAASYLIGAFYHRKFLKTDIKKIPNLTLYLIGLVVHIVMLALVLTLPEHEILETYKKISLTILGVYPVITLLIGKILLDQQKNIHFIKEISEREELYRTTLYSIGDAVITTDVKGKIQQINPVAEQLTGWQEIEAKEMQLSKVFKIINESTREEVESPVEKILKEGKTIGLANHTLLISKSGNEIPIADSGAPIFDKNQNIKGVVLVFRDQTSVIKSQEALWESERSLREIFNSTNEAIFLHDAETGKVLDVNEQTLRIFGYEKKEEIINASFEDLNVNADPYNFETAINKIKKTIIEGPQVFEWLAKKKNGETFWLEVSLRSSQIGGKGRVLAVARDISERKNAEREIREATELRKAILDNASYAIISADKDGIIKSFNPAAERITGYSASEVVNKYTPEIFHDTAEIIERAKLFSKEIGEEVEPGFKVFVIKAIHKLPNEYEWTYVRKDDTRVPVFLSVTAIYNSKDQITGYLGIAYDISERKQSEKLLAVRTSELKESEEKYRTLFEQSKDAMLIIDNNVFVDCNDAALDMLRFKSKEELFNTHPSVLSPPIQPDGTMSYEKAEEMMSIAKTKGSHRFEWVHRKVDGEEFFVEVTLTIIPYQKRQIIHTTWRDITDRKRAEEKIIKLSKGIEQSPATIIISDKEGNIEYVNPKFSEITGYSFREVFGANLRLLKSGYHDNQIYKNLWETISSGNMWKGELLNKKKNGDLYWELVSISPIRNEKGDITNYIAVKEDITERKKMMEDLIVAKENAEKTNQLKSEFLAQMSHEIRSPINTMVSFTSLIEDELRDESNEELEMCFSGIESASKRVIRTIDLILNMSELQLGTYEVSKREINLSDVIYNLMLEYMKVASMKHLELDYITDLEKAIINTDDYALNQIFANLIDNAIKYTNEGKVEISLAEVDQDKYVVQVSDTGIGISQEYLGDLFEPFSQEEQGYSRKFEGNGLGMSLVKRYCDLINAEISVESDKGKGTKFRVILNK